MNKWIVTQSKAYIMNVIVGKIRGLCIFKKEDCLMLRLGYRNEAYATLGTFHFEYQAKEVLQGIMRDIINPEIGVIEIPQCYCDECQSNIGKVDENG